MKTHVMKRGGVIAGPLCGNPGTIPRAYQADCAACLGVLEDIRRFLVTVAAATRFEVQARRLHDRLGRLPNDD